MSHPMLLTERDWQWWFGVSGAEAKRLLSVQRVLAQAGIDCCPETVLGMSRTVLADALASQRLRTLADLWDAALAPPVAADPGWPMETAGEVRHHHRTQQTYGSPGTHLLRRCQQRCGGSCSER